MVEHGVWAATTACMVVSLSISFWAGRRFESFWPKIVFFLIASIAGIFLFLFSAGIWAGTAPAQEHLIYLAFRKQFWVAVGGVVAMAYVGAWRLPRIISDTLAKSGR